MPSQITQSKSAELSTWPISSDYEKYNCFCYSNKPCILLFVNALSACVQIVCYEEFISVRLTFLDLIDSVTVWHIGKGQANCSLQGQLVYYSRYIKLDCI